MIIYISFIVSAPKDTEISRHHYLQIKETVLASKNGDYVKDAGKNANEWIPFLVRIRTELENH